MQHDVKDSVTSRRSRCSFSIPDNRDFITEYKNNFYKKDSLTYIRPHERPQVCVHHVDPSFYTTTMQASYGLKGVAPQRVAYTSQLSDARHIVTDKYLTTNQATYGSS
ncbi:unnamed protein product [Phytomonas sp. Hart1]|nr:unnamed protein product [Phytomonas sp. Hart1]|eukprot:CCW69047.1 unnamed protein product [Phytomonas sp. isolate Hart1]